MDNWKAIHEDVKDIKILVLDLVKQGAINTTTLVEHERRSTNLEARIKPLEDEYTFITRFGKTILGLGAVFTIIRSVYELLKILK
jgi:hypothetical protein